MVHYFSNLSAEATAEAAMALLFPVLIWTVMLYFLWSLIMTLRDGVKHLQQLHRIPCDRCRYYTGSHYLKCPVHPVTAFSQDAIECQDFEPVADCQSQLCRPRPADKDPLIDRR
ncbi:MAG: hypothetical protein AAF722_06920 [Cyanobacteria bacterium P01_C01_bin.70]